MSPPICKLKGFFNSRCKLIINFQLCTIQNVNNNFSNILITFNFLHLSSVPGSTFQISFSLVIYQDGECGAPDFVAPWVYLNWLDENILKRQTNIFVCRTTWTSRTPVSWAAPPVRCPPPAPPPRLSPASPRRRQEAATSSWARGPPRRRSAAPAVSPAKPVPAPAPGARCSRTPWTRVSGRRARSRCTRPPRPSRRRPALVPPSACPRARPRNN